MIARHIRIVVRILIALLIALLSSPAAVGAVTVAGSAEAVVLKDFEALSAGDVEGLAAVFAPRFAMYGLPTEAHTLIGPRSDRPDNTPPDHAFTVFRVRKGLIETIWHIAREPDADPQSGAAARTAIRRLGDANNRGDADAFAALYHPDAKHFHSRHDPAQLGGGPSKRVADQASRRRFYRGLFAKGAPSQVSIGDSAALGEWVATRERYTAPDSPPRDHLTVYRVRNGLIIDDWHVAP